MPPSYGLVPHLRSCISHWVPPSYGLVPHLSKKLSKLLNYMNLYLHQHPSMLVIIKMPLRINILMIISIYHGKSKILQYFCNVNRFQMLLSKLLRWLTTLDYEMPSSPDTLQMLRIGFASGLEHGFKIHEFKPNWLCLIVNPTEISSTIKLLFCDHLHILHNKCFSLCLWRYHLVLTCKA